MSDELREQIRNSLYQKDIYELLEIWRTNNRVIWSDATFDVLKEILNEKVREIPIQNDPIYEHEEVDNKKDNLEDWEAKLLDDDDQPELYDTLQVLMLIRDINKVATAVVVVNLLIGLLDFGFIRALLQGTPISLREIFETIAFTTIFTFLKVGLNIAVVYFPLKALNHILRILMEMEFNSRKAKS